jgi:hypothetical protein
VAHGLRDTAAPGDHETPLPHVHYGIREGDLIAFTRQHRPAGKTRVENGTRGEITALHPNGSATITLDGSNRRIVLPADDLDALRLAYAQHVYRQQGATVERSIVLTGGWQTSKETAYVEATRARQRTDWYIARDDLGQDGQDPQSITRLAERMRSSSRQTPSLAYQEPSAFGWEPFLNPPRPSASCATGSLARPPHAKPRPHTRRQPGPWTLTREGCAPQHNRHDSWTLAEDEARAAMRHETVRHLNPAKFG